MSRPTPDQARKHIVAVLGNSVLQAIALKVALDDEHQALENQDLDALGAVVETKSQCVARLQELENERRETCSAWGFDDGPEQIQQLLAWCDDGAKISNCWEQLMVVAAECSARNFTNGSIIRLRQQQIETGLSVLRGEPRSQDTYNRYGTGSGGPSHRSLAEA